MVVGSGNCPLLQTHLHLLVHVPGGDKLIVANAVSFIAVKHVLENLDNFWQVK